MHEWSYPSGPVSIENSPPVQAAMQTKKAGRLDMRFEQVAAGLTDLAMIHHMMIYFTLDGKCYILK